MTPHHSTHHHTPKPHSESTPTMANQPPCPIKRAKIIEALRENPCQANELAELTGVTIKSVRARLASMVRDGIIQLKKAPHPHQNLLYSLPVADIVAGLGAIDVQASEPESEVDQFVRDME